jgi:hypothetical protein
VRTDAADPAAAATTAATATTVAAPETTAAPTGPQENNIGIVPPRDVTC